MSTIIIKLNLNRNLLWAMLSIILAIIVPTAILVWMPAPNIKDDILPLPYLGTLIAAVIHLLLHIENLKAPPTDQNGSTNEESLTYRAQQLAEKLGVAETVAHKMLVFKWTIACVIIPAIFTLFMGVSTWLFVGYLIYPAFLMIKFLFREIMDQINILNNSMNNLKD